MNKVILIGNIANETKYFQVKNVDRGGLRFSLAVDREYKDKDGNRGTDFIEVVYWSSFSEKLFPYLTIGKKVCVSGRIIARSYTKEDGTKKYITEIEADNIDFLDSKRESAV